MEKQYSISIYPGSGTADGLRGDHVLLSPAYTVTAEDVGEIVERSVRVIEDYFSELKM
jgi:adenosylmethionine-8-amino-7-oxononanoate aminotransferase